MKQVVMKKSLRDRWVRALRSGKYKQIDGSLEKIDSETGKVAGNCCLGVLCRIADVKAAKPKRLNISNQVRFGVRAGGKGGSCEFIPEKIATKLGLRRDMQRLLAEMNDGDVTTKNDRPYTFRTIATFIERRLKVAA